MVDYTENLERFVAVQWPSARLQVTTVNNLPGLPTWTVTFRGERIEGSRNWTTAASFQGILTGQTSGAVVNLTNVGTFGSTEAIGTQTSAEPDCVRTFEFATDLNGTTLTATPNIGYNIRDSRAQIFASSSAFHNVSFCDSNDDRPDNPSPMWIDDEFVVVTQEEE